MCNHACFDKCITKYKWNPEWNGAVTMNGSTTKAGIFIIFEFNIRVLITFNFKIRFFHMFKHPY